MQHHLIRLIARCGRRWLWVIAPISEAAGGRGGANDQQSLRLRTPSCQQLTKRACVAVVAGEHADGGPHDQVVAVLQAAVVSTGPARGASRAAALTSLTITPSAVCNVQHRNVYSPSAKVPDRVLQTLETPKGYDTGRHYRRLASSRKDDSRDHEVRMPRTHSSTAHHNATSPPSRNDPQVSRRRLRTTSLTCPVPPMQ